MEPFSLAVAGKVIVFTIGTIVLVVVAAQFVSQLSTSTGLEWFQELPRDMQVQVMQVAAQTTKGKALLPSLVAAMSKSRVNAATVMGLIQSYQTFTGSM